MTSHTAADPRLIEPGVEWEAEYRAMAEEFRAEGEQKRYEEPIDDFAAYVRRLDEQSRGIGLAEGIVPSTTYWLVRHDGAMLGMSNLRHRLTPKIEDWGGHIGYAIRPSERRKGYGTQILALVLDKARELGLGRVLVTCDTKNTASTRIIQKHGGMLASESYSPNAERVTSRYWIDLSDDI